MKSFSFNGGKFKLMQIADTQDTQRTSPDTVRFIKAALRREKPDLVIFTGDQIKGYGFNLLGGDVKAKIKQAIKNQLAPLREENVPFIATFGNHDAVKKCGKKEQAEIYKESGLCCAVPLIGSENDGIVSIPVYSGGKPLINFYIADTPKNVKGMVFSGADAAQIEKTAQLCEALKEENGGEAVPSILFQHIPVPEMYSLLKKVPKGTKGAVLGNEANPYYYILPPELTRDGGYMKENIASPLKNTGQFDGWKKQGDVIAAYFGHDHINSFSGTLDGIELGYTPGAGFNVYGPGLDRAVRIFEFSEEDPTNYKTRLLTYRQAVGTKVSSPVKYFVYTHCPSSVSTAKPLILKTVAAAGAVTFVAMAAKKYSK